MKKTIATLMLILTCLFVILVPACSESETRYRRSRDYYDYDRYRETGGSTEYIAYETNQHEVRWVIWTEYYGFDSRWINRCERLRHEHQCEEDDIVVLAYISRATNIDIEIVFQNYLRSRRDLYLTAEACHLHQDHYIWNIHIDQHAPDWCRSTLIRWRSGDQIFLNHEIVKNWIWLRIGINYCGFTSTEWFSHLHNYRHRHFRCLHAHRDRCGAGLRNYRHRKIVTHCEHRPWNHDRTRQQCRDQMRHNGHRGIDRTTEGSNHRHEERDRIHQPEPRHSDEARRRAEEEARKRHQEEDRRRHQEELRRKKAEQEAQKRAEEEARHRHQEEIKRRKAEQEAQKRAEEEARKQRQEEDRRRHQEELRRKKAEQEAKRRAEAEARKQRQEEQKRRRAEK